MAVLRATGRGFCAGVDIKEINAKGDEVLVGVATGAVPPPSPPSTTVRCRVIAAVQGFRLGGGIGLVGNVGHGRQPRPPDDATFGLPEVDRGALGAATDLARLVPEHAMAAQVGLHGQADHRR